MSLYVFCMVVLSLIYILVFGVWWDGSAPFKVHLSALAVAMTTTFSGILMIAIYPILSRKSPPPLEKPDFDKNIKWGRDISNKLSSPAVVLDGYNIIFANKPFLAEVGLAGKIDEVIGMPLTNMIHPSDHHNLAKFIASSAAQSTQSENLQARILCSDGTTLPAFLSLSPLREGESMGLSLLQFSSSITPNAVNTNTEVLSGYQMLIDRIEQIVFQINVDKDIIFLSPSWQTLLDHSAKDSLNRPLLSYIHPEDRPLVEARINSLAMGKRNNCQIETRLISKNGDSFWTELRAKTTSTYKGERSSVIGTFTDISRMKSIEAGLRSNRRSLSMLLSNIPGMVYRCKNDRNWSFEFASDGCLEVTGYEPYEMVNSPYFSFLDIIHPEDKTLAWECVQKCVAQQQKFQLLYRIVTRSGKTKWVWEQGKGVFSSAGELLALEGFITDISNESDNHLLMSFQQLFAHQEACPDL